VKNWEYCPSPYPLPPEERGNKLKKERNSLPLEREGEGGGDLGDFFTASGGWGGFRGIHAYVNIAVCFQRVQVR